MHRSVVLLGICALLAFGPATSTAGLGVVPGADPDPGIQDPGTWLGRPFGSSAMTVDEVRDYLAYLAESSARVGLEFIGTSVQGDPLLLVVVSDPARRDELEGRAARVDRMRDAWAADRDEREELARSERALCWIAGSVHGDEASGVDAAVLLAWHLAADRSDHTREILDRTIVVIDPCQNPDGRRRFLQQVRDFGRQRQEPDPSPWAAEHWSSWPGGRTNHFLFDLNRDWAFLTQAESRARVDAFLRWRPQVFVDLHEMGRQSSYFFPPPTDPINPNIADAQLQWFEVFGRANARAFDARGFDYFVGETFDLFYPGFGDSWPTLQGAVGMTYEQASTRGRRMRRPDGSVAGFADAVEHHFVAALTTVQTTAAHASGLMDSVVDLADFTRERAGSDRRREIVIDGATRPAQVRRLADVLDRQGIRLSQTTGAGRARLRPLGQPDAPAEDTVVPPGSLRIPLDQPAYGLVRSLLDLDTPLDEDFLREEEERIGRGLHARFYDVTAWSLVLGYGLRAWSSDRVLDLAADRWEHEAAPAPVEVPDAEVAWVLPCRDNSVYPALELLWAEDVVVHCALDGVMVDDELLPRGTLVVRRSANAGRSDLPAVLSAVATRTGVGVVALDTSFSPRGPSLGSDRVVLTRRPKVGLLSGPGVRPLSAGALTWLFEERYGLHFTVLLEDALDEMAIEDFDVLVVPELSRGTALPLDRLDGWVREGGVLVAIGSASLALIDQEDSDGEAWTTVQHIEDLAELSDEEGRLGGFEVGEPAAVEDGEPVPVLPPERRPLRVPGAIFRVDLDPSHFLSIGVPDTISVPVLSERILTPSISGRTVGRIDDARPLIAGYTWPVMEEALKGQAWLVDEPRGRGRVILFAEDPSFRGTWEGLHPLLLNGVLLGPNVAGR